MNENMIDSDNNNDNADGVNNEDADGVNNDNADGDSSEDTAGAAPLDSGFDPAYPNPPVQTGLVRDPYATFGGVLSGIAHRYGWDVSLTRLAFLGTVALSFGTALFLYIAAWIIVPRATYWPPVASPQRASGLSNREIGIGLTGVGVLVFLMVATGSIGAAVVPVALVVGGVWLLLQQPRTEMATAGGTVAASGQADLLDQPAVPLPDPPTFVDSGGAPAAIPAPVPPRKGRRRWLVGVLIALAFVILAGITAAILVVTAAENGGLDINVDTNVEISPTSVSEFPISVSEDAANVVIDLSALEKSDFALLDDPLSIDVNIDAGSIEVIIPEDLTSAIEAEADVGSVVVDGQTDDGFRNEVVRRAVDPDLDLDLDVNFGNITVTTPLLSTGSNL